MSKKEIDRVFEILERTFSLVGVESLTSLLEAYRREEIEKEEVLERFQEFNKDFDLVEFLKGRGQRVRNEAVKLGKNYYSVSGVISLGTDTYYDSESCSLKYQIVLNPTTSDIIKLLYANVPILQFDSEKERDEEMNYLVDKLNLIGIRHLTIR